MSSHDGTVDGVIGFGGSGGQVAIGDPDAGLMSAEAGAAGGLTLDEAENIAARRLQELAIRLGDDEAESPSDEPGLATFDADRHLRTRLAQRMTSRYPEADWADEEDGLSAGGLRPISEMGVGGRYVVSEALPLAAFGDSFAALATGGRLALPAAAAVTAEDAAPANDLQSAETQPRTEPDQTSGDTGDAASPARSDAMPDSAMRLVDLIKEQRILLDRLGRLRAMPLGSAAPQGDTAVAAPSEEPSHETRSDAEELFVAGTYASESARSRDAAHEDPDPVSISAEQLIAALGRTPPEEEEVREHPVEAETFSPVAEATSNLLQDLVHRNAEASPRLQFVLHQPSPLREFGDGAEVPARPLSLGLAREERQLLPARELISDHAPERPPIIIERARAEMTALANGAAAAHVSQASAAIGFFAGLSLSIACGVVLYYML